MTAQFTVATRRWGVPTIVTLAAMATLAALTADPAGLRWTAVIDNGDDRQGCARPHHHPAGCARSHRTDRITFISDTLAWITSRR